MALDVCGCVESWKWQYKATATAAPTGHSYSWQWSAATQQQHTAQDSSDTGHLVLLKAQPTSTCWQRRERRNSGEGAFSYAANAHGILFFLCFFLCLLLSFLLMIVQEPGRHDRCGPIAGRLVPADDCDGRVQLRDGRGTSGQLQPLVPRLLLLRVGGRPQRQDRGLQGARDRARIQRRSGH